MTHLIAYHELSLDALAELANDAAEQAETQANKAVRSAIVAGEALLAAKAAMSHGEWLPWLKSQWNYSQQWASSLMQAANYARGRNLDDFTSVKSIMRAIADERAEQSAPEPSQEASPVAGEAVAERGVPEPQQSLTDDCSRPPAAVASESAHSDHQPTARRSREPRDSPAPRLIEDEPFHLAERLDADRVAILAMAGDYLTARHGKHFVALLRKIVMELEGST